VAARLFGLVDSAFDTFLTLATTGDCSYLSSEIKYAFHLMHICSPVSAIAFKPFSTTTHWDESTAAQRLKGHESPTNETQNMSAALHQQAQGPSSQSSSTEYIGHHLVIDLPSN
jgi:hypothetical protein